MHKTTYYDLNLPEGSDRVDVAALNENSEVIDFVLAQLRSIATAPVHYSQIVDAPMTLPASDVYPWAKASVKPVYTPADVGTMSTAQIESLMDALSDRIEEVAQQAANIDAITNEQISSLFDDPYIPA